MSEHSEFVAGSGVGRSQDEVGGSSSVTLSPSQSQSQLQIQPETESSRADNVETGTTSSSSRLHQMNGQFQQHLNFVARKFNILDRLFRGGSSSDQAMRLQVGASSDGVFSNLMAKPERNGINGNGEQDKPPTYDEAAADMAPPYYGIDDDGVGLYYNEICIDGLPVGNIFNFLWNVVVSFSFQFVGFLLTYILHTSHAARQGSRFGLGVTFIGYGYSMIPNDVSGKIGKDNELNRFTFDNPDSFEEIRLYTSTSTQDEFESDLSHGVMEKTRHTPALAIFVILLGGFIIIKSIWDYIKVKRMEARFLQDATTTSEV
ncbi:Bsd2 [Kluyveromyces lactis]|nr:Bsd2 [Kluyveromyces lactis]